MLVILNITIQIAVVLVVVILLNTEESVYETNRNIVLNQYNNHLTIVENHAEVSFTHYLTPISNIEIFTKI